MLPVRRIRNWIGFAELSLATLLGVTDANAQATGATAPPAAPPTPPAVPPGSPDAASPTPPQASLPGTYSPESDQDTTLLPVRDVPLKKPPPSARWLLIGAGAATTGLFYAGGYGIGAIWPDAPGRPDLRIPVAGPFMDLSHTGCPSNDSDCSTFQLVLRTVLVSFDALGQVGGVALMLQGAILGTTSVESPRGAPSARLHRSTDSFAVVPVPWVNGRNGGGLSLSGRF